MLPGGGLEQPPLNALKRLLSPISDVPRPSAGPHGSALAAILRAHTKNIDSHNLSKGHQSTDARSRLLPSASAMSMLLLFTKPRPLSPATGGSCRIEQRERGQHARPKCNYTGWTQ